MGVVARYSRRDQRAASARFNASGFGLDDEQRLSSPHPASDLPGRHMECAALIRMSDVALP
jgi:hypothetical protein